MPSPPTITGISPSSGPTAGGTSVIITGTNFTGATSVYFLVGAATSFTVNSSTQITAISPSYSIETVDIRVTTSGGTSAEVSADQFTFIPPPPTITGISPTSGTTGGSTPVTITGTNFTSATSVMFGTSVANSFSVNSSTQITAYTPPGSAGTIGVTVTTLGGTSSAHNFTYTLVPYINTLSPLIGNTTGGTPITITGVNFTGTTSVIFGASSSSFTVNSDTQIIAYTPTGSVGTVGVTVTTPIGTTSAFTFTYTTEPYITGISPAIGTTAGGTSITISGAAFTGTTSVMFGALPATSFIVNNDAQITAINPAEVPGTINVTVTTLAGSSASNFTYQTPVIISLELPTGNDINLVVDQICQITALTSDNSGQATITLLDATEYTVAISNVSTIVNSTNSPNFVETTLPGGTGAHCWMLLSAITGVIQANEALNNPGASGNTRVYGIGWGYVDVTDSLATILAAIS